MDPLSKAFAFFEKFGSCKTALSAVKSLGLGPLRQMFMSMSTVSTSSEFRYSDLSLPIQENPLSQQDEDTAITRQISTTINMWERSISSGCTWLNTSTQNSAWLKFVMCLWSQQYSFRDLEILEISHWSFATSKSKAFLLGTAWKCWATVTNSSSPYKRRSFLSFGQDLLLLITPQAFSTGELKSSNLEARNCSAPMMIASLLYSNNLSSVLFLIRLTPLNIVPSPTSSWKAARCLPGRLRMFSKAWLARSISAFTCEIELVSFWKISEIFDISSRMSHIKWRWSWNL